ncbi:DNA replication protein DnaC [Lachnospiraceae bacterium]|nr:DNA replication protein DnaC [Lachnospiraceae bacterium]
MALSDSRFNEIMSGYESARTRNAKILAERKASIRRDVPGFHELEKEIADAAIESAARYMEGDESAIADLREKISRLSEKKTALLLSSGHPADWLSPIYDCPDCKDTGYIGTEKCHCLKQKLINALYAQSNLMEVLDKENFSTCKMDLFSNNVRPDMEKAYNDARTFVKTFANTYTNMLFLGNVGSGKTFLSNCIAKAMLDEGYSVVYFSAFRLFRALADHTFRANGETAEDNEFYSNIFNADLLIIDDLGTETVNSFVRSELFLILNERHLRRHSTIISSNLDLARIKEDYSERSFSRILSGYDLYRFKGEDLRLRQLCQ